MNAVGRMLAFLVLLPVMGGFFRVLAQEKELQREVEEQVPLKRFEWFYHQRQFPNATLDAGYLVRALEQERKNESQRRYSPSGFFTWTPIVPGSSLVGSYGQIAGRFTGVVTDPTNPSIIYIAAADGGVWKSVDAGASWNAVTDHVGTLASGSIAIDPSNPNTLFYGTGEPYYSGDAYGGIGVLKSTDGGASWFSSGLSNEKRVPRLAIDPNTPSIMYAATWGGLYRSTNAGASWTKVIGIGYVYDVVIDPTTSAVVYAGVGDNAGGAGVWKSVDSGKTYTKLGGGFPASGGIQRIRIAVAPSDPSILYSLFSDPSPSGGYGGAYKSTDAGTTWTNADPSGNLSTIFGSAGGTGQGWYDIAAAVSPSDPNLVFMSGIDTWRSTNGGSTWANVTNGYAGGNVHVDHHALVFDGSTLYLCTDGGLWKTVNNGNSWTNLNNGICAVQFYDLSTDYQSPGRVYGGTQDNGTQRTTGTINWTDVLGGDGGMSSVDYTNSNFVYGERQNGDRNRSTNGGTSWTSMNTGIGAGPWVTPIIIHPVTHTTVFTSANDGYIYRSTNQGVTWAKTSTSPPAGGSVVTFLAYNAASSKFYASSTNRLFTSTDEGQTWTARSGSATITDIEFDPSDSRLVYVTFSSTATIHIYKSTNDGTNWTNITGDLPNIPVNALKVQPGNSQRIYIGTDIGVYVTTNGGTNWIKETSVPDVAVIDLELTSDNFIVAGTHGRGAWKASLGTGVSGIVLEDGDADSTSSADRIPAAGRLVKLMSGAAVVDSQTTSGTGEYSFTFLADGSYDVLLAPKVQWVSLQSIPGTGANNQAQVSESELHIDIVNGQVSSDNNFLSYRLTSLQGIVYEDRNGDGTQGAGEPVLPGRSIYLGGNKIDSSVSDAAGRYSFANLVPGLYTISESLSNGWMITSPPNNLYSHSLVSGDSINVNLGNFALATISGLLYRDSDQDGSRGPNEPTLESWQVVLAGTTTPPETAVTLPSGVYTFTGVGPDDYSVRALKPSEGWGQIVPPWPWNFSVITRSGLDSSGLDFGFFPMDSIKYRTASLMSWAFATDAKGKYKSVKRKADKVDFEFLLAVPIVGPQLLLEFSMDVTGTIWRVSPTMDSLASFTGKKIGPLTLGAAVADVLRIEGRGTKGKQVKVKFAFANQRKASVVSFVLNQPRLPMPDLHNLGEELFSNPSGFLSGGLHIGLGGAHSVFHPKYRDVQKSLNKKGSTHTNAARCLDIYTRNNKPISKQLSSLPIDKQNNVLFGELIALKLNMKASVLGKMPPGLENLIYRDDMDVSVLNGLTVEQIAQKADTFMTLCSAIPPENATAADYNNAIHAINSAFDGPLDTISFAPQTVLRSVRYLAQIPFLHPNFAVPAPASVLENFPIIREQPDQFEMFQNYPNPFNPTTTIEISLPEEARVTIKVYDILGREVAILANDEVVDEGTSEFVFDGQSLASGMYFYRLVARSTEDEARQYVDMKKMILIK